jgi:Icc-related predicted phosphoesterase
VDPSLHPIGSGGSMRILAIADIHGATEVYEWLRETAAENGADLLILAGDLLIGGWEDEQSEHARAVVVPLLRTISVPVCYVMGNDDHVDLNPGDAQIRPVHGRRLDFGPWGIVGYQYSPPFVGGCHEKTEGAIAADLRRIEPLLDEATILVTHSPVHRHVDLTFSGEHAGSRALAEMLNRSNFLCHIHGHIHHSFGRSGNHFNVAAGGRRRAVIIDLPSLSHRVIEGR